MTYVPGSYPASSSGTRTRDDFPQVFGKYVLLRPMARGGMGELFLAAAGDIGGFEKLCVVKKVLTELEDDGVRRRFLDEAKVVVRLNHANLVQVFDAGRVGTVSSDTVSGISSERSTTTVISSCGSSSSR